MKIKRFILYCVLFSLLLIPLFFTYQYMSRHLTRADIAIYGPILMADGIGRHTAELAHVLAKKHRVQILSRHINKTDLPKGVREILKTKFKKPARVTIVEESLWAPGDSMDRFFPDVSPKDEIRLAYTMLESTRIIPEWVLMINLYFDGVIVPDPFLVEAYQKSGVTVPVFCIPLGIDLAGFLAAPLKESKTKGPFVFASLSSGIERKNHILMIQAFAKAFGNNEDVLFYINCRTAEPEIREAIQREIEAQNCSNIKYTEVRLRKDAYLKFFQSIDCLLSLSKGEGYSIQPREAMALGIPVVITDNTGQSTICKSGLVKTISSVISEPRYYFGRTISAGKQFNCDLDEAVAAIQDVYENYSHYAEKGAMMRKWVSVYNYENLKTYYHTLVAPKKVVLGDINEVTADCITTNSQDLYEKYSELQKLRSQ